MKRFLFLSKLLCTSMVVFMVSFFMVSTVQAEIIATGAIDPADHSTWTDSTRAVIGKNADGTLSITNGSSLTNRYAYIGAGSGANGAVTVDGEGSKWEILFGAAWEDSYITGFIIGTGSNSTGTLTITNGGSVISEFGYIGEEIGSKGIVIVGGEGSTWSNEGDLYVGYYGTAALDVTNGGQVNASSVSINSNSTVTVDMGSSLKVGTEANEWTGSIENGGTIRLVAGALADSGTYTPMSYGTMSGDGSVQVLGGVWDESDRTVTVSEAVTSQGYGGATVALDIDKNQRALITDSETGLSAGAAFSVIDTSTISALDVQALSTTVTLTATVISDDDLVPLENLLAGTGENDSLCLELLGERVYCGLG